MFITKQVDESATRKNRRNGSCKHFSLRTNFYSSARGSSWKQEMATTSGVPNDIEDANKVCACLLIMDSGICVRGH